MMMRIPAVCPGVHHCGHQSRQVNRCYDAPRVYYLRIGGVHCTCVCSGMRLQNIHSDMFSNTRYSSIQHVDNPCAPDAAGCAFAETNTKLFLQSCACLASDSYDVMGEVKKIRKFLEREVAFLHFRGTGSSRPKTSVGCQRVCAAV